MGVLRIKNQCASCYRGCFEGQKSLGPVLRGVFFIDGFFFCIRARGFSGCFEDKKSVCPVLYLQQPLPLLLLLALLLLLLLLARNCRDCATKLTTQEPLRATAHAGEL